MKLTLANGTFFKNKLNFKEQLDIISQLNIDGVELTFRYPEELDSCLKDKKFIDFLSKFKYNTIHAPFGKKPDIKIYNINNINEILNKLKKISDKINAKNIVFHPYNFEEFSLLKKINNDLFTIENTITENMDHNKLKEIFNKYDKLRFTLDTSHSIFIGDDEFDKLFDNLKDKIKTVHLSNAWEDEQHKQFLNKNNLNSFSKILELNGDTIITLEENFDGNFIGIINKEIAFVKKWLNTKVELY